MKKIIFTICALSVFFSSFSQLPNYLPTSGLIAWYPFSGNANDISGNGNNGSNNGATLTTDRFGNTNRAYLFNGIYNWINIPYSSAFDLKNAFTISAWSLRDSLSTMAIVSHERKPDGASYNLMSYVPGGASYMLSINNDIVFCGNCNLNCISANTDVGVWQNIVGTWDGQFAKIYINGILANSISGTLGNGNTLLSYLSDIFIGKFFTSNAQFPYYYFKGKIDDVGIWNRALTSVEITNLYEVTSCQSTFYDTTHISIFDTTHLTVYDTTYVTKYDTVQTFSSVTDTLRIDVNITGLTPPNNLNTFKVYPNPVKDKLFINTGNYSSMSGYTITLTNSIGQVVFVTAINQQLYSINLSSWTGNGLYFLTINDPSNKIVEVKKIILE